MTRDELAELAKKRNNQYDYAKSRERRLAQMKKYYAANKERILFEQKRRRLLKKNGEAHKPYERYAPKKPSQLEAALPTLMQNHLPAIRTEYLLMPIAERMLWPYDYFLRMKVLEHFKSRKENYGVDYIMIL